MKITSIISVEFNLVTSESKSLLHMLERSNLSDALSLTNNALSWYKIYCDTKTSGMHMIAKNPSNGCYFFINDNVRAGDMVQRQALMLSSNGIEKISANFIDKSELERDVHAVLSDAFFILDQIITAQSRGLVISSLNGKTQTYEELMGRLRQFA